jgi:uncharacterized coiled-coil protein SlyX
MTPEAYTRLTRHRWIWLPFVVAAVIAGIIVFAWLEAEVERYRFIAASGARDFEIQRERIAELEAENAELQKTPNELRRVLAEVRTENAKLQDALLRIKYSFAKGPGQRFGLADARAIAHAALEDTHESQMTLR